MGKSQSFDSPIPIPRPRGAHRLEAFSLKLGELKSKVVYGGVEAGS